MSLRFSSFYLAPHDHLVVRPSDPDSTIPPVYFYPNQTFHSTYGLDAPPMATTRVVATLVVARPNSLATQSCVHISGYTAELERPQASEAICGVDRTQEAACYKLSAPSMFAKSNAVARLVINRDGNLTGCTGWLLGSEGHLVTNNHCIDEARQLVGIRIEFLAQTDKCPQSFLEKSCMRQLACTGEQWRGSTTFVYTNKALDYTLIQLTSTTGPNVATKYGFLRLRATGPQVGEPIYIVQHPQAWGKRISDKTATGRATVAGLNLLEAEYFLDTQAMSSGSPVTAHAHYNQGKYNDGIAICDKLYDVDASRTDNLLLLGALHFQLRNFSEAIFYNQQCIRIEPQFAEAFGNLGAFMARCVFVNAIDPTLVWLAKGNALKEIGDTHGAIQFYLRAIKLNPRFADVYNNLASSYMQMHATHEAIETYKMALVLGE
ncbi:hypothetical protein DYB32_008500 [Aphanomyces invadans]|uniref:Serine protease n=1 Tax=Aphanomyces invadans TaxID=157072 RepID=A0A418AL20_9STRA|nr:hypothetical protein DYB32_008500 [Aphanomyces invadans]